MQTHQTICCPNCGGMATRYFWIDSQISECLDREDCLTRTECLICDYFLVINSRTGNVIESYAPGLNSELDRKNFPSTIKKEKIPAIATI